MTDNEVLQKIKNALGLGNQPAETQDNAQTAVLAERERAAVLDAMKNGNSALTK